MTTHYELRPYIQLIQYVFGQLDLLTLTLLINEEFYEDFLIFEVERELKLIKNEKFNREYELINREIQYYGKEICNIA